MASTGKKENIDATKKPDAGLIAGVVVGVIIIIVIVILLVYFLVVKKKIEYSSSSSLSFGDEIETNSSIEPSDGVTDSVPEFVVTDDNQLIGFENEGSDFGDESVGYSYEEMLFPLT